MKNTLFLFSLLLIVSLVYSSCGEDDEQNNNGGAAPYEGCCAASPETYTVDGVDLYIPNSFTPDNNGLNDLFLIFSSSYPAEFKFRELTLTSRGGDVLFQIFDFPSNDNSFGWDGEDLIGMEHTGYFQYTLTIEDTAGNTQLLTGSSCALNCEDSPLPIDDFTQCTFGLQHDGEGGYNSNLNSEENDCF